MAFCSGFNALELLAGLQPQVAALYNKFECSFDGVKGVLRKTGMLDMFTAMSWGGTVASTSDPAQLFCWCGIQDGSVPASAANRYAINGWQLLAFVCGADGIDASDIGGLLGSIDPGWALSSKKGTIEACLGVAPCGIEISVEPEAREALGKHADAITAAQVLMESAPFQKPAALLHRLVVARCESAIAGSVPNLSF